MSLKTNKLGSPLQKIIKSTTPIFSLISILGIGGNGARKIAELLYNIGYKIHGFDLKESVNTKYLSKIGIPINFGKQNNVTNSELIIYSHAIPENKIEKIKNKNRETKFILVEDFLKKIVEIQRDQLNIIPDENIKILDKAGFGRLLKLDYSKQVFIGVTGTDGKTTTCMLTHHILNSIGYKAGVISSTGAKIGNEPVKRINDDTTPSSDEINSLILKMQKANCTHIIIESSSQGLSTDRLIGIKFDVVTCTNITSEHLDYHKTWEEYLKAKKSIIINNLKDNGKILINKDDPNSNMIVENSPLEYYTYSIRGKSARYNALNIIYRNGRTTFNLDISNTLKYGIETPLPGEYNISNVLGVIGILDLVNIKIDYNLIESIKTFYGAKGRMEIIIKKPITVIVDFAHTGNGLYQALKTSQRYKRYKSSKLIGIVGSSGSEDHSNRPILAKNSANLLDITIVAPINPRQEDQNHINDEFIEVWKKVNNKQNTLIHIKEKNALLGRRKAFETAISLAKPGDVIIATSKGHQTCIKEKMNIYPWSEINEFKKILNI